MTTATLLLFAINCVRRSPRARNGRHARNPNWADIKRNLDYNQENAKNIHKPANLAGYLLNHYHEGPDESTQSWYWQMRFYKEKVFNFF